jgi:hypothetical protein
MAPCHDADDWDVARLRLRVHQLEQEIQRLRTSRQVLLDLLAINTREVSARSTHRAPGVVRPIRPTSRNPH